MPLLFYINLRSRKHLLYIYKLSQNNKKPLIPALEIRHLIACTWKAMRKSFDRIIVRSGNFQRPTMVLMWIWKKKGVKYGIQIVKERDWEPASHILRQREA